MTPAYLGVLLDAVEAAKTPDEKGKTLENCAFYLFGLLPGCVPRSNLLDIAGASEYDVVVNNMSPVGSLVESLFGREFLIECKNWAKAVGVQEVGYFLLRMGLTHCRFGVILARNGITEAAAGEAFARNLVRRAFHEHGSLCVVLDLKDLRELAAGQGHSVTGMLIERVNEFRFGR